MKILIVKVDHIGDYVLFRNFLKPLKEKYPNSKITLIGNKSYKDIVEHYDSKEVDKFIGVNQNMFYNDEKYRDAIHESLELKYDMIIHPTFSRVFTIDELISRINAKQKIAPRGDAFNQNYKLKEMSDNFYSELITTPGIYGISTESYVDEFNNQSSLFSKLLKIRLDRPNQINVRVHEFEKQMVFFSKLLDMDLNKLFLSIEYKKNNKDKYAILFPGATSKLRKWSPKKFAKIANFLCSQYGLKIVICGSADDINSAEKIIKNSKANIENMVNKTSLPELIDLIGNAEIAIVGNTGAIHIAVATKTKSVCIDTGIFHGRFVPYQNMDSMTKLCLPFFYFRNFHGPINLVSVSQVKNKIIELI